MNDSALNEGKAFRSNSRTSQLFRWGGVGLLWLLLGGIAMVNARMAACTGPFSNAAGGWANLAARELPPYLIWALLTPVVFSAIKYFPVDQSSLRHRIPLHLAIGIIVILIAGLGRSLFHDVVRHDPSRWHRMDEFLSGSVTGTFEIDLLIYAALVAAAFGIQSWHRSQERARRERELENQLTAARYQALRVQMEPHFLFNTLNTVSSLADSDPARTRKVVSRLSELLRRSLADANVQEATLEEEIRFVDGYLEIEKARYGDRLAVEIQTEPGLEDALVPTMLLQPLVENAVRYGVSAVPGQGQIGVRAFRQGDKLTIHVQDTGPGPKPESSSSGNGMAIENARQRLRELYGRSATLDLESIAAGGCLARLSIPLHFALKPQRTPGEVSS